jgi:hypothetical protein
VVKAPQSPLADARAALEGAGDPKAAGEAMKALADWIAGGAEDRADVGEARALLARSALDLAVAPGGEGAAKAALEAMGRPAAGGSALGAMAALAKDVAGAEAELVKVAQVAGVVAAAESGAGEVDVDALRALLGEGGPEATALRRYVLERLAPVAQAIASGEGVAASLAGPAGRLLCASCADPDPSGAKLLGAFTTGEAGLVCPEARGKTAGMEPAAVAGVLQASCDPAYYGVQTKAQIPLALGGNYLAVRTYATVLAAAGAPGEGAHAEAAAQAGKAALASLGPVALDVPFAPAPPAAAATEGPASSRAPLDVAVVDKTSVRMALRPVLDASSGKLEFLESADGFGYPGAEAVSVERLLAPPPSDEVPEASAAATLAAAVQRWKAGADAVASRLPEAARPLAPEGASRSAFLAVSGEASAAAVQATAKALVAEGYGPARLVVGGGQKAWIPALLQRPTESAGGVVLRWTDPVLVHVTGAGTEIFPAGGKALGEPAPTRLAEELTLPDGSKPWYLWEDLFKAEVALGDAEPGVVAATVAALAAHAQAGNTVTVEVAGDVPATRWAPIVQALTGSGTQPVDLASVFPGTTCAPGGPACPARLPVILTGASVPRSGQLTEAPRKRDKKAPPVVEVAKPAPSAEFCNKADIAKVMGGRKGGFQSCYERVLQTYPDLKGRVVMTFVIPESGRPTNFKIASSEIKLPEVHQCLKTQVMKLTFAPPKGGECAVQWPLLFQN